MALGRSVRPWAIGESTVTRRRVLSCVESDSAGVSGIEAMLVVEQEDDGSAARIVDVRLRSLDGHGLRANDLRMLEGLGLTLPPLAVAATALPAVPAEPAAKAAAKPVRKAATKSAGIPASKPVESPAKPARKAAGKKAAAEPAPEPEPEPVPAAEPAKTGRTYRPSPELDVLDAAVRDLGDGVGELARHFDVPRYTITSWLERHRRNGHLFPGDPAPTSQED
jgi:hypothetical protein